MGDVHLARHHCLCHGPHSLLIISQGVGLGITVSAILLTLFGSALRGWGTGDVALMYIWLGVTDSAMVLTLF